MSTAPARDRPARDRTTLRRGLLAGGIAWAGVAVPRVVAAALGGAGGRTGLAAVLLGLCCGGLVASGWLLLAVLLDTLAGEPPGARRLRWTAAVVALTACSPVLFLAAGG